jgi:hypothetical protein
MDPAVITVVSGLPRSGTSLMMSMLQAGGLEALVDHTRQPDEDNPRGYLEFEKVKELKDDRSWLKDARGKVVKAVSAHLQNLPRNYSYKVIFMRRQMEEILASQRRMLLRRGEPADRVSDEEMARLFTQHLDRVTAWLTLQPNMPVLYIDYNELLKDPTDALQRINAFLGGGLRIEDVAGVIDPTLYRQRR